MSFSAEWLGLAIGGWLIVEVIKKIIDRKWAKGLKDDERNILYELHQMHLKTDDAGKPIWYIDPKILENQKKVMEEVNRTARDVFELKTTMHALTLTLKEITVINAQIVKTLDKINDKLQ